MGLFDGKKKTQDETVQEGTESITTQVATGNLVYGIIKQPHVTEKAAHASEHNKYTFKVDKNATKIDIKNVIEKKYKVKVSKINITNIPAKTRRVGRYIGKKPGFKKAIITLREGERIDVVTQ